MYHVGDEGDAIQQVGEAGRIEQDAPVAHAALLLQIPEAGKEELIVFIRLLLGVLQLHLLVRDLHIVLFDQRLSVDDLGGEHGDLLFQHGLLLQLGICFILKAAELVFQGGTLLIQLGRLRL